MSEKIYLLLLRFHAARFRQAYGEEAVQLFRDRARDERGLFAKVRLWFDLLGDLAVSVPRGYWYAPQELMAASGPPNWDNIPSFQVLDDRPPSRGALVLGGILSVVALAAVPTTIGRFGGYRPLYFSFAQSERGFSEAPARQDTAPAAADRGGLDSAARHRLIQAAAQTLKEHYMDAAVAQRTADALLNHEKNGDYDAITEGPALAAALTSHLRDASGDMHLDVAYTERVLQPGPARPSPAAMEQYRKAMEQQNCTFEKTEIRAHNIGYVKLNSFPEPSVCGQTAAAAMAMLNGADAIIFDLRDNGGGYPGMVMLLAGYLFDHPEYIFSPRDATTRESWTQPVAGNRLADKPVYVLTSKRTASAAECFSYDLKMLKRATLVGETTRGAAHAAVFRPIADHFGMGIPEAKPINPFSDRDWEGVGVEPDVRTNAADALDTALKLAPRRQAGK
ncbi:MAG TPA: S41 family peptidase [Candidatus Acidoferrales bacterium]|nr:S41 family peptidase [Candidatus Acidoferrales bacterium]